MTTPRRAPSRLRPRPPQPPTPTRTTTPVASTITEPKHETPSRPTEPEDTTPTAPNNTDADEPILYTPEQAAALLQVRPSWLRRRAAARAVPCRFLGKHLRFTRQDLLEIATASHQPPRANQGPVIRSGNTRRRA
ncbi:helix-turn-helix domain-containing protein [Saccharothrix sp.]|uniref:helix-turn-helix domain-containing protein n=1 Tax=Saccharothrix sp. TaxID=1873460 RepID=UPI002811E59D|nr:helix-turn-helix domain-containing protein [Saccharothrix sp.]